MKEVDIVYDQEFFKEEKLKEIEKLPNKIKLSLEKEKIIEKEYNDNKKAFFINNCIKIENNLKEIIRLSSYFVHIYKVLFNQDS